MRQRIPKRLTNPYREFMPAMRPYLNVIAHLHSDSNSERFTPEEQAEFARKRRRVVKGVAGHVAERFQVARQARQIDWLISQYVDQLAAQQLIVIDQTATIDMRSNPDDCATIARLDAIDKHRTSVEGTLWELGHEVLFLARQHLELTGKQEQASLWLLREARCQCADGPAPVLAPDGPQWPEQYDAPTDESEARD